MPAIIDRLNAEVRAMQIQLRRKQEAAKAAERRALDAEAKLLPLLERRERKSAECSRSAKSTPAGGQEEEDKKKTKEMETLRSNLEEERRKFRVRIILGDYFH